MSTSDSASSSRRKFKARRLNEHVKSIYSLSNTLAAGIIGAAYIVPVIRSEAGPNQLDRPGWVLIGFVIHVFGHVVIRLFMRSED